MEEVFDLKAEYDRTVARLIVAERERDEAEANCDSYTEWLRESCNAAGHDSLDFAGLAATIRALVARVGEAERVHEDDIKAMATHTRVLCEIGKIVLPDQKSIMYTDIPAVVATMRDSLATAERQRDEAREQLKGDMTYAILCGISAALGNDSDVLFTDLPAKVLALKARCEEAVNARQIFASGLGDIAVAIEYCGLGDDLPAAVRALKRERDRLVEEVALCDSSIRGMADGWAKDRSSLAEAKQGPEANTAGITWQVESRVKVLEMQVEQMLRWFADLKAPAAAPSPPVAPEPDGAQKCAHCQSQIIKTGTCWIHTQHHLVGTFAHVATPVRPPVAAVEQVPAPTPAESGDELPKAGETWTDIHDVSRDVSIVSSNQHQTCYEWSGKRATLSTSYFCNNFFPAAPASRLPRAGERWERKVKGNTGDDCVTIQWVGECCISYISGGTTFNCFKKYFGENFVPAAPVPATDQAEVSDGKAE